MTDNVQISAGSGTSIAADDIGSVFYQRVKMTWGADGTANDVSTANPVPISDAGGSLTVDGTVAATQSGTWNVTNISGTVSLPTGAATETSLAKLPVTQGSTTSGQSGPLIQGAVSTSAPTYTNGQTSPLSLDASGQLRITGTVTAGGLNQGSTTSGQQGALNMGAVTTAAPSYTTGQTSPLSLTTGGLLRVDPGTVTVATHAVTQSGTWNIGSVTTLPALAAGDNIIGVTGGITAVVTGSFSRPADTTAYASGDLVANSTTAGSVTPVALSAARINAGTGAIRRCRLSTSKTGLAGTDIFRVHLFKTSPTAANGDNGAFSVNGVAAVHIGYFDVLLDRVFSDGAKGIAVPASGAEILFDAAGGTTNIYALVEARGAYTPASGETFTIALEVMRD